MKMQEILCEYDTRGQAFRNWFGNSKVVDTDGNPLVVYRGRVAPPSTASPLGVTWVTTSSRYAGFYATGQGKTPGDYRPERDTIQGVISTKDKQMRQDQAVADQLTAEASYEELLQEIKELASSPAFPAAFKNRADTIEGDNRYVAITQLKSLIKDVRLLVPENVLVKYSEELDALDEAINRFDDATLTASEASLSALEVARQRDQGGYIEPYYVNASKPYLLNSDEEGVVFTDDTTFFDKLRKGGYDSVIWATGWNLRDDPDDLPRALEHGASLPYGPEIVLLNPDQQIKSAVGNRGTYDPNNPNITEQL